MSNDFDIESLSKAWQSQQVAKPFDETKLKKKLLYKRLSLLAITTIEVVILLVTAWLLILAVRHAWPVHLTLGLVFAFASGGFVFAVMSKSRLKSFQMITRSTKDWMHFERGLSEEALQRGRLAKYFIASFSIVFCAVFVFEWQVSDATFTELALRFSFGIAWLGAAWLINAYQMKKHRAFLSTLK